MNIHEGGALFGAIAPWIDFGMMSKQARHIPKIRNQSRTAGPFSCLTFAPMHPCGLRLPFAFAFAARVCGCAGPRERCISGRSKQRTDGQISKTEHPRQPKRPPSLKHGKGFMLRPDTGPALGFQNRDK